MPPNTRKGKGAATKAVAPQPRDVESPLAPGPPPTTMTERAATDTEADLVFGEVAPSSTAATNPAPSTKRTRNPLKSKKSKKASPSPEPESEVDYESEEGGPPTSTTATTPAVPTASASTPTAVTEKGNEPEKDITKQSLEPELEDAAGGTSSGTAPTVATTPPPGVAAAEQTEEDKEVPKDCGEVDNVDSDEITIKIEPTSPRESPSPRPRREKGKGRARASPTPPPAKKQRLSSYEKEEEQEREWINPDVDAPDVETASEGDEDDVLLALKKQGKTDKPVKAVTSKAAGQTRREKVREELHTTIQDHGMPQLILGEWFTIPPEHVPEAQWVVDNLCEKNSKTTVESTATANVWKAGKALRVIAAGVEQNPACSGCQKAAKRPGKCIKSKESDACAFCVAAGTTGTCKFDSTSAKQAAKEQLEKNAAWNTFLKKLQVYICEVEELVPPSLRDVAKEKSKAVFTDFISLAPKVGIKHDESLDLVLAEEKARHQKALAAMMATGPAIPEALVQMASSSSRPALAIGYGEPLLSVPASDPSHAGQFQPYNTGSQQYYQRGPWQQHQQYSGGQHQHYPQQQLLLPYGGSQYPQQQQQYPAAQHPQQPQYPGSQYPPPQPLPPQQQQQQYPTPQYPPPPQQQHQYPTAPPPPQQQHQYPTPQYPPPQQHQHQHQGGSQYSQQAQYLGPQYPAQQPQYGGSQYPQQYGGVPPQYFGSKQPEGHNANAPERRLLPGPGSDGPAQPDGPAPPQGPAQPGGPAQPDGPATSQGPAHPDVILPSSISEASDL